MQFYGNTLKEVVGKAVAGYGKNKRKKTTSRKKPYGGKISHDTDKFACAGIVRGMAAFIRPLGARVGMLDTAFNRIKDELGAERRNDSNFLAARQKYADLIQAIRVVQVDTARLTSSTNLRQDIQSAIGNLNMRQTIDMLQRSLESLQYTQSPTGFRFNLDRLGDDLARMKTQFQNAEQQLQSLGCLD